MPKLIGKIGGKIAEVFGGQVGEFLDKGAGIVDRFVRTADEKAEFRKDWERLKAEASLKTQALAHEVQTEFNNRIKELEGTASDLIAAGLLGKIVLFMRGAQRPLWGYGVMYLDYMIFSKAWMIEDEQIKATFWVINLLVLGFLFGERAVKNVGPIIKDVMKKK